MTDQPAPAEPSAPLDLEAIKKHVYQLQMYDFRGGLGINHLTNVMVPALISEVERLRAALRQAEARPNAVDSHDIVRFSQTDMDRQTKPLHVEIERLKARQAEAEGRQDGLARSPDTKEDP